MREWMTTPSVVVDEHRLRHNIHHMQQLANANNVQLRPHVKTHKTLEIATLQLQAGACGITVSKPSEALKFLHSRLHGLKSILLAYPVVQFSKFSKLLVAVQQSDIELRVTVDSMNGLDAIERAAKSCDCKVGVLIHIDVGYHRVGLEQDGPRILEFAQRIHKSPNLEFLGLLSHAGHAYGCATVEECTQVAETERGIMIRIKTMLEQNGVSVPVVSVGSTLTEASRKNFVGITEIRFFTLHVCCRPRSSGSFGSSCYGLAFYEHDFEQLVTEPTQNKTVLSDGNEITCFEVTKLSEEHGWIKQVEGIVSPPIGQRMIIVPNHSCVVVNLTDMLYIQGKTAKSWKVFTRGCTQ